MPLLLDSDYEALKASTIPYEEDVAGRFLVFTSFPLPKDIYQVDSCDVLVVIPTNYPQAGNDMFWTNPPLQRKSGAVIPAILGPGGGDNRIYKGREFCRWSRHWQPGSRGAWRPGKDEILSIYRRVEWAFAHPDC